MLLWLNGTFGVGKTTTAELIGSRTDWRLFDPEHVGYLLAANLQDIEFSDFQDLSPWRTLVPTVAREIHRFTDNPVMVAVQTVLVERYWAELSANFDEQDLDVFHVVLDCETDELRRRIESDEEDRDAKVWRLDHVEAFDAARPWLRAGADAVIDTTNRSPDEVATEVIGLTSGAMAERRSH